MGWTWNNEEMDASRHEKVNKQHCQQSHKKTYGSFTPYSLLRLLIFGVLCITIRKSTVVGLSIDVSLVALIYSFVIVL